MSDEDIEIYNDGILLFWGDNDILTYYDYENNIVNSLPITIQKQDAHGENFNEGDLQDKDRQAQRYIINDIEVNIYLLPNLKVILCKNNKTGETKRYNF
jgi:beta-glucanase (GH16 family)